MAKDKLSPREIKTLAKLLKKMPALPNIPRELFISLMSKNTPATAELAVIRGGKVLLVYRNDGYYKGWHFPGSFISPGESFLESCRKTAEEEIGLTLDKIKMLSMSSRIDDKRFSYVSLFFASPAKGSPKCGEWFNSMPRDIISGHRELWKTVRPLLKPDKK